MNTILSYLGTFNVLILIGVGLMSVLLYKWGNIKGDGDRRPNFGKALGAWLALTTIIAVMVVGLHQLDVRTAQVSTRASEAMEVATNAFEQVSTIATKADNALAMARKAEGGNADLMKSLGTILGTTNTVDGGTAVNFDNLLTREAFIKAMDKVIDSGHLVTSNQLAALRADLEALRATVSSNAAVDHTASLRNIDARLNDLARTAASAATNAAIAMAKAAEARALPGSVIQKMTLTRAAELSYKRAGLFKKHPGAFRYQVKMIGRPDMEAEISGLLERFEKDHNATLVKIVEDGVNGSPEERQMAQLKLSQTIKTRFNDWVLGKWSITRFGQVPQIESVQTEGLRTK